MQYDTVPDADDECSCGGEPKAGDPGFVEVIEVENLRWVTSELKVYPDDVVPGASDQNGYFLTGEVLEDDPRQISIGGWDATEWDDKPSALGHCCLWISEAGFEEHDLDEYVVDEWDGGRL